jgi:hypothetical protein
VVAVLLARSAQSIINVQTSAAEKRRKMGKISVGREMLSGEGNHSIKTG